MSTQAAKLEKPAPSAARLVSLDAFRGWTMFWIVGGTSLLFGLERLGQNPILDAIAYQLRHSEWEGLRFYDLIWPSFMLMTGMSLPFSYAKRSLTATHAHIFRKVLWRAMVLFLLGSLRESVSLNHPYWVELSSALQPIGIAYFCAFLIVRRSWAFQAGVGAGILLGYGLLLAFVPPASYAREANLVLTVDLAVLGRAHQDGWGTVLSTVPTIATTILGMLLGRVMRTNRTAVSKGAITAGIGLSLVVLGYALSPVVPVVMKLWTVSYGLASAGWSCLCFALFYWIFDVRGYRKFAFPFVVIGANALAIYMAGTVMPLRRVLGVFTGPLAAGMGAGGALFQAAAVILVEWLILYWMYKRKIFLVA